MASSVVLPFLMSMLLGRTIDLTSYSIRGNIYDDTDFSEAAVNTSTSVYNVLQDDNLPYTFFGIPADIVLRIKSGFLSSSSGTMGLDGVLKDTSWKYNSVIVTVTTVIRTVDRNVKPTAEFLPDWSEKIPKTQTHYASSLYYGGWSVVLFRFKCDIPSDVLSVRNVLTEHLGNVDELTNNTIDKWESAMAAIKDDQDIRGSVRLSTHIYSTVPIVDSITTPESLLKVIRDLPGKVGALGQPIYMELKSLNDLDKAYPLAEENTELVTELEKIDEMFDDVKVTKVSMMRWVTETLSVFKDEQEEKVSKMLDVLNDCIRAFNKVGAEVSLFKKMDRRLLDNAVQKYIDNLERGVETYNLVFRRLKEEIDAECEGTFLHKIRGLLRVYDQEMVKKGEVKGGLQECQKICLEEDRCRAIGYAPHASELDRATGLFLKKIKQCWIYFRSTSTATVYTPNGLSGELAVYDRKCY